MSRQPNDDRPLERLLRAVPEEPGGLTAACVDGEQLAAWSEGGLTPAERETLEAHAASCARCLAMLAVFSETAPAAVHAGTVPERWRFPMRWLVPITTAAAAVLIWVVLPARPPAPVYAPTTQIARDEAAPIAPRPPSESERQLSSRADQARESAPRQAPALAPPQAFSKAEEPATPSSPVGPPSNPSTDERRRQAASAQESVRLAEEPAAKATDSAATVQQKAANEAFADRVAAGAAAPPPPAPAPTAALRRAEATEMIEIASPDPAYRWRVRGTVAERSTTGGASWQPVTIPASAVVTGGVAPGPSVCWLIGPAGTVLRTTDGSRFDAVSIPGAGALMSIQAVDANRATVGTSNGTTYTTTDGGRTWTR